MQKIPTIFDRDWEGDRSRVLPVPVPDAQWVFDGEGKATRKLDGTCCLVKDGKLWKRQEVKPPKKADPATWAPDDVKPAGFVEEDRRQNEKGLVVLTGWVPVGDGPEDQWHREAWAALQTGPSVFTSPTGKPRTWEKGKIWEGTYELVGPQINGNPEGIPTNQLISHDGLDLVGVDPPRDFEGLRDWLAMHPIIEGIVWHHSDGRMAKIKLRDFGIQRGQIVAQS